MVAIRVTHKMGLRSETQCLGTEFNLSPTNKLCHVKLIYALVKKAALWLPQVLKC